MGNFPSTFNHEVMAREKRRVAITSVIAAVGLTATKLAVGLWTGSLGILSEALHSGLDLVAALITVFAVRYADRPADSDHQYGHGKIENLAALIQAVLLLVTCGWILHEAWERLSGGDLHIQLNVWAFAVIIVSIMVDISRSRALSRVAKKYDSQALEADALHFHTDIYTSLVVLFGLLCVAFGWPEADAIAAIIVACIVIWISLQLGKRTIDGLLDRVPAGMKEHVERIVMDVDGVESIRSLRIRPSGGTSFINLVIGIQRTTFFDKAHGIVDDVEAALSEALPRSDVLVHSEPVIGVRERLCDTIEWMVRQSGLSAHNIQILWVNDGYVLNFDIEYRQGTSFVEAHALAIEVEQRIRENISSIKTVLIHLEEDTVTATPGDDVSKEERELLARVREMIISFPNVCRNDAISCYSTSDGLHLTASFTLPCTMSLGEMHTVVDEIETNIKALDHRIHNVFLHAAPEVSTQAVD